MALKAGIATGNWSAAAAWESIANVPSQHLTTNITVTGTIYTAAFTAPNISNNLKD